MSTTKEDSITMTTIPIPEEVTYSDRVTQLLRDLRGRPAPWTMEEAHETIARVTAGLEEQQQQFTDCRAQLQRTNRDLGARTGERDDLLAQIAARSEQLSNLQAGTRGLIAERDQAQIELARFKHKVSEVATKYAANEGWCGIVDDALSELGLTRLIRDYKATLKIEVEFKAKLSEGQPDLPDESWVRDSLTTSAIERAIKAQLGTTGDHSSIAVEDVEFEVMYVTMDND